MEVEVKLRLPDSKAHQSLSTVLSPFHKQTHFQHNVFFDGAAGELSSRRAVLRLRFYGEDSATAKRCVVSLKAKALLVDGVSRVEEDEEEIDPDWAREIWANPNLIGSVESRILKRVRDEFGIKAEENDSDGGKYVCLGGFKNVRGVYEWNSLTLELDETLFDFGTLYEVECESAEPDKAKELIEGLLKQSEIPYTYSAKSKFAIFISGKLPEVACD
ncbi:triphosphate tunnel metalloenzyme 3 isoform X3 [Silene latifolia]